jgi:hypothetical protein
MARRPIIGRYHPRKRFFIWRKPKEIRYMVYGKDAVPQPEWDVTAQTGLRTFKECGDARGPEFLAQHIDEAAAAAARVALRNAEELPQATE